MLYDTDVNDFNSTVFEVSFPADEGLPRTNPDIPTPIAIVDDEVNEAEQYFVAYLEILDAVNYDLINIGRNITFCAIVDNDGEFSKESNI